MDRLTSTDRDRFWFLEVYARDRWVESVAKTLAPGSKILDAGAGASKYRPLFAHCEYQTQDFCRYEGPLVRYVQPIDLVCEITAIPLPTASLDAILCTEVFEHLVDPMAALVEFNRLLKPGGKLFLTAPMLSHLHMEPFHFYAGFTRHWYEHWLPAKGFAVESMIPVGGPGRTAVVFLQSFYLSWSERERTLGPLARFGLMIPRAVAKLFVHYLLPATLPQLDPWLGTKLVCSGYLVTGIRK